MQAVVDCRTLRPLHQASKTARHGKRPDHFRTDPVEALLVLESVEFVRAEGVVFAVTPDKVVLFGGRVLRRVPVLEAPVDASTAQAVVVKDELNLPDDNLLAEQGAVVAPAVAEDLEEVMEEVMLV